MGANYRYFLRWRHAAVVGDLVVLWAVITLCISAFKDAKELMWIIPLFASPIGIIFRIFDVRTRDCYHAAINSGADLEKIVSGLDWEGEEKGFYTRLKRDVVVEKDEPRIKFTQSLALDILFFGTSIGLLVLSIFLLFKFNFNPNLSDYSNKLFCLLG